MQFGGFSFGNKSPTAYFYSVKKQKMKRLITKINKLLLEEKLSYVVIWMFVLALPLIGSYYRTLGQADASFEWDVVLRSWKEYLPFLFLFIVHDWLIAPLIVHDGKKLAYLGISGCALLLFSLYIWSQNPGMGGPPPHDQFEMHDGNRAPEPPHAQGDVPDFGRHEPPQGPEEERSDFFQNGSSEEMKDSPSRKPDGDRGDNPPPKPNGMDEPPMELQSKIYKVFVALLMMGVNLGIMLYFKQRRREKDLQELEKEKLHQELEYLKYQINPHFFMNTLNNIHALVDIDPEKAKSTIIELSRLMRYVLYESSRPTILLSKEIDFLKQYIALMRLRYTDKVDISVNMPAEIPGIEVPPLLFISFIENAFKHGVSYEQESFIKVNMQLEGSYLHFSCENSKHERKDDPHKGIGLENVKKRLKLIYGNDFFFLATDKENTYEVTLKIPVNYDTLLGNR